MDKNPRVPWGAPVLVLCRDAMEKERLLLDLLGGGGPAVLLDTDLLHTGYARSLVGAPPAEVLNPAGPAWRDGIARIADRASRERILVVLDTLNGAYGIGEGQGHVRAVNSCVMLLARSCKEAGSALVVLATGRQLRDGRWVLAPGGRRLPGWAAAFLLRGSQVEPLGQTPL
ncbi:MAG: hypothetical protein MPI95_03820 [Nitrosopumilus sp.]|nr:hypothetical protein [Nitrosopumilus sp.]MDA7942491.1 hypothetical protein [Nitrosopumilus sp.]MDA7958203.1 hypothetical protein [Nitrosopumilus sp.]